MSIVDEIEPCHCDLNHNLNEILAAIQGGQAGQTFGCGQADPARLRTATQFRQALQAWQASSGPAVDCANQFAAVCALLGSPDNKKMELVAHLIGKLLNNGYKVYPDDGEDFETVESRIQHLDICNFNWDNNLLILLEEIGTAKRSRGWHGPGLFCAHGDKDPNNSYPTMLKASLDSIQDVKAPDLLEELKSKLNMEF